MSQIITGGLGGPYVITQGLGPTQAIGEANPACFLPFDEPTVVFTPHSVETVSFMPNDYSCEN